jgi:microcystin-dependent protein
MTKKLSDKLGDVFVTTNPQSSGLAGETIYYSGDTSGWEVIGGVTQQDGWALCDGAEVTQAEYPDLFEAIGTAWNFGGETGFRLPTIPDVVGNPINAVAIVALYNNLASVVSTRDLSVNKLSIDTDLAVGTSATIPDLTVTGTLTADAVVSNSGETVSDVLGEIKASVLTKMQFQSLKGTGWVLAHGQPISRTMYADLYALIGDTYGEDEENDTFNLPDLRERYIRGTGDLEVGLGDFRADTTRVDNVAVVTGGGTKTINGNANLGGGTIINASILNISNNAGNTNNAGHHSHTSGNYTFDIKGVTNNAFIGVPPAYDWLNSNVGLNTVATDLGFSYYNNNNGQKFSQVYPFSFSFVNSDKTSLNRTIDISGNTNNTGDHTHNVNISHNHNIAVNNAEEHVHSVNGNTNIDHSHNLTGDTETAPKSVILNYFIKIA